ncbi:5'-nucleotidase C-terminal domain-containing protein [Nocardioides sp. SR21]|uniref:5'-nucleotidase C-terminal domain-containing protein n=1 Tax=Nocardioides sp. SR21 TaxID=2919501 RepID=UPI001FA9CFCB|nr:5'-nucleotidase C-terminal domain-containing protein [Nocardioides sp. SR21]
MPPISRARRGVRSLVATTGLAVVATSTTLIGAPAQSATPNVYVNVVATNDFHGRIKSNGVEAGAAVMAGAVNQMRETWPNTVFAAAGDLIGASTFESFINQDKPTIDALNAAGLEVSAAGNHEFDKGYDDLVNRVMAPYDATTNPFGGAEWEYIAANVVMKDTTDPALEPTFVRTFNEGAANEVKVGFVGAVTEHLPELVTPAGIEDIEVTDIVDSVNTEADALKADGVDAVVMLVHEGAPSTNCDTMDDDPTSDFGSIVTGANANVDAIVSGHTHLAYNCKFPVAAWQGDANHPVKERPVVSAGQYGYNLNRLGFTISPDDNKILNISQNLVSLTECVSACGTSSAVFAPVYPADATVKPIVDAAVADAEVKGAAKLGEIADGFKRAARGKVGGGSEENRGGESTLGNLVAEVQRWATESETAGGAQIAFMNPGGLRKDMVGSTPESYPSDLTYKQAADVQPFANTLVNMQLTGAQIQTVLEQQWQPEGSSRPFLRLGTSAGFRYTYDPTAKKVTGMWLDDEPISPTESYSVTVNSFLSTGGDNFFEFANGTGRRDTGKIDLEAMVDYLAEFGTETSPLPVDFAQHAVGVEFPTGAPATYAPGSTLAFDVSSLAMTGAGDDQDTELAIELDGTDVGTTPVDNTVAEGTPYDESGTASVSVALPDDLAVGEHTLTLTGATTGTVVTVPFTVGAASATSKTTATVSPDKVVVNKTKATVKVTVKAAGEPAAGKVEISVGGNTYKATLANGKASVTLKKFTSTGKKTVKVKYLGNAETEPSSTSVTIKVVKK